MELRFEVPNALLQLRYAREQLGDLALQRDRRGLQLPDDLIPLPTPRTLRLRRHFYLIGSTQRRKTPEQGGVNDYE